MIAVVDRVVRETRRTFAVVHVYVNNEEAQLILDKKPIVEEVIKKAKDELIRELLLLKSNKEE